MPVEMLEEAVRRENEAAEEGGGSSSARKRSEMRDEEAMEATGFQAWVPPPKGSLLAEWRR
jgi:hypothetical protein